MRPVHLALKVAAGENKTFHLFVPLKMLLTASPNP